MKKKDGQILKEYLVKNGISKKFFAKKIGYSRVWLYKLLSLDEFKEELIIKLKTITNGKINL